MVRRNFCLSCPVSIKRQLYISLVRSQVTYGSQIWRPRLIKDIWKLEQLQRRATKYILQDYSSNYKHRLLSLSLLPLSMLYELNDIMFFVRNIKNPTESFNVQDYVSFNKSNTRSNSIKLVHKMQPVNKSLRNLSMRWSCTLRPVIMLLLPTPRCSIMNLATSTLSHMYKPMQWKIIFLFSSFLFFNAD